MKVDFKLVIFVFSTWYVDHRPKKLDSVLKWGVIPGWGMEENVKQVWKNAFNLFFDTLIKTILGDIQKLRWQDEVGR